MGSQHPIPVTIIGGYLGAGKTTLVNHLLRNADGRRIAVLVNEFGALPIDEDLIEAQDDDLISIAGGCICCSFGDDLTAALQSLGTLTTPPDHVLVECSGVAMPGAIAWSLSLIDTVSHDSTVVLLSAETGHDQARDDYIGDTITRQLVAADLILLTKADLVGDAALTPIKDWLKGIAPQAQALGISQGRIAPDLLFGPQLTNAEPGTTRPGSKPPGTEHADTLFDSLVLPCPMPLNGETLAQTLADPTLGVTRAKGFFLSAEGTHRALQLVGSRWDITSAAANVPLGIVCIGLKGQFDRDALLKKTREAQ